MAACGTPPPYAGCAPSRNAVSRCAGCGRTTEVWSRSMRSDGYWLRDWRSRHETLGTFPEHHLWDAVNGYLDLRQAVGAGPSAPPDPDQDQDVDPDPDQHADQDPGDSA